MSNFQNVLVCFLLFLFLLYPIVATLVTIVFPLYFFPSNFPSTFPLPYSVLYDFNPLVFQSFLFSDFKILPNLNIFFSRYVQKKKKTFVNSPCNFSLQNRNLKVILLQYISSIKISFLAIINYKNRK